MDLLIPSYGLILWTLIPLALFIISLIDILRHKFDGHYEKLIWVLVILFVPILGAILYWTIGRRNRIRTT